MSPRGHFPLSISLRKLGQPGSVATSVACPSPCSVTTPDPSHLPSLVIHRVSYLARALCACSPGCLPGCSLCLFPPSLPIRCSYAVYSNFSGRFLLLPTDFFLCFLASVLGHDTHQAVFLSVFLYTESTFEDTQDATRYSELMNEGGIK